ncbi:hypothetical protein RJ641_031454 [Dillenia turbinata]|uniref:Protein PARTING DANCERS n=1 Tax=Dillenia turbinata TaxID=194707 RepID=A0AAN8VY43_9MAGN
MDDFSKGRNVKLTFVYRAGLGGVCLMSTKWRDQHPPSVINFISSFLGSNSFRLHIVQIAPDFIFNCGGLSMAFVFITNWDVNNSAFILNRVRNLKGQFANFYVVVSLPARDQNDSFVRFYFKYTMEVGRPTFMPVQDIEMGFEKIVKIAIARGVGKKQGLPSRMKSEKEQSVQMMDHFLKVITSIPGIDNHDAYALNQAIGSIEAIARSSKEYILESTDLSADKAETISKFFRDPKFFLSPKIN